MLDIKLFLLHYIYKFVEYLDLYACKNGWHLWDIYDLKCKVCGYVKICSHKVIFYETRIKPYKYACQSCGAHFDKLKGWYDPITNKVLYRTTKHDLKRMK